MTEIIRTLASMPAAPEGPTAPALLATGGPTVVLGGADPMETAVAPSPTTMFGPRGAVLLAPEGPLVVSDTGHHRLLVYPTTPTQDGTAAAWQFGQPDFATEGRNGGLDEGPRRDTLNVPTGVAPYPNPSGIPSITQL